jgi:TraM recognition site of TraD and TraG
MTSLDDHVNPSLADHINQSAAQLGYQGNPGRLHDHIGLFVPPLGTEARAVVELFIQGDDDPLQGNLVLQGLIRVLEEDRFTVTRGDSARNVVTAVLEQTCERAVEFPRLSRMPAHFTVQLVVWAEQSRQGALRLTLSAALPSWSDSIAPRIGVFLKTTPEALRKAAELFQKSMRGPLGPRESSAPGEPHEQREGHGQHEPHEQQRPHEEHGRDEHAPPPRRQPASRGRIVAPGEVPTEVAWGDMRDYAGCATEDEVADLRRQNVDGLDRVLPLGRYFRFGQSNDTAPLLYLPGSSVPAPGTDGDRVPAELPVAYQGALVVAPQDSGKTKLIVRWAKAANRAGYSLFLVDVKGNLHQKLLEAGLGGEILHFTTQPGVRSDRINFLAGMGAVTNPALAWQVRQLAHAILPDEGFEEGEQKYFLQNRMIWLRSLIHLLKLKEAYVPRRFVDPVSNVKRVADLADLYAFIADPQALFEDLKHLLRLEEGSGRYRREQVFGGARAWISRAALLFSKDEVPGGQRGPQATYQEYVQGLLTPLESFAAGGILCEKIKDGVDQPGARLFSLDRLGADTQVTILLTAREQELDDAVTVTSMAVKRLQQLLFERMGQRRRPILMLLDETRRIRSFRPGEYITFAREAMAGCVIVYQSLDQIKDEREITEILENVGTQIYLGGVVGKTAERLIQFLPKRWRPTFSHSMSVGFDGTSSTGSWEQRQELGGFFETSDLFRLPTGPRGALVYLKSHPGGRPFIVDLDEDRIAELR